MLYSLIFAKFSLHGVTDNTLGAKKNTMLAIEHFLGY